MRLIIFDLDGTLVNSREHHYKALNKALESIDKKYVISEEEHLSTYDGLPTSKKLQLLTEKKDLPLSLHSKIWELKQKYTSEMVKESYKREERIISILNKLRQDGYLIFIASNSVWRNVVLILTFTGLIDCIDWFISSSDVKEPKPSPEMYLKCFIRAGVSPLETLIIEDSPIGQKSALLSGAHLLCVKNPEELSYELIQNKLRSINNPPFNKMVKTKIKCNVVVPMAGGGTRFAKAGYTFPKPLIDVKGKPMIEVVVNNLNLDLTEAQFTFIVQEEHCALYDMENFLKRLVPNCNIIKVKGITQGAVCSVLLSKNIINNEVPLVLANCDQFVEWNSSEFFYSVKNLDAGILTFNSKHPKWSYVRLDKDGFVEEVAEKKVISDIATVGIYYYKKGSDFVECAEEMINNNERVNNEFYVCPVFNYLIKKRKKIRTYNCDKMWGLGVPEDLEYFLKEYKGEL